MEVSSLFVVHYASVTKHSKLQIELKPICFMTVIDGVFCA